MRDRRKAREILCMFSHWRLRVSFICPSGVWRRAEERSERGTSESPVSLCHLWASTLPAGFNSILMEWKWISLLPLGREREKERGSGRDRERGRDRRWIGDEHTREEKMCSVLGSLSSVEY